jgi:hypothetical protein
MDCAAECESSVDASVSLIRSSVSGPVRPTAREHWPVERGPPVAFWGWPPENRVSLVYGLLGGSSGGSGSLWDEPSISDVNAGRRMRLEGYSRRSCI